MPTYTDSAEVLLELPEDPPSAVTNALAADIAAASDLVEAGVGPSYPLRYFESGAAPVFPALPTQKFPDVSEDPGTPQIIKRAATYLAASRQFQRLGQSVREGEVPQSKILESRGEKILRQIRDGDIVVTLAGASLQSSGLVRVEDTLYADRDAPKATFNPDDLDLYGGT